MMLAKLKPQGRIKPKYKRRPSDKELEHHLSVMSLPCAACGKEPCGVAHHLMQDAPDKRWRRDHEFVVPLCDTCHRELHNHGNERAWCEANGFDAAKVAIEQRNESIWKGIL